MKNKFELLLTFLKSNKQRFIIVIKDKKWLMKSLSTSFFFQSSSYLHKNIIARWTLKMDTDYQVIFLISALISEYLIFNEHLVCEYKDISINVEQIGFALILQGEIMQTEISYQIIENFLIRMGDNSIINCLPTYA